MICGVDVEDISTFSFICIRNFRNLATQIMEPLITLLVSKKEKFLALFSETYLAYLAYITLCRIITGMPELRLHFSTRLSRMHRKIL